MLTEDRLTETLGTAALGANERILELNEDGLLAEVLGYETREVAQYVSGTDVDTYSGEHFIDFTGGIAVHACGHNHPEVVAAAAEQARQVLHTSDVLRHAPQLELADKMRGILSDIRPGAPWQFLFLNSGSESIDAAAKLALKATGRSKFITFEGAFHGRTLFATALSRSKTLHWNAYESFLSPLRANIRHAPAPRCAGCQLSRDAAHCCANGLDALLREIGPDVAAVYLEAEQGEGGYFPMAPVAAQKIREATRKHGVLLIADEIQSGWGRTGKWFGFQHLGIEPDIVVFGKAIGGGLPLAGFAAREGLMEQWTPGEHGTTFGGNPVACAAGLAALRVIEREGLVERAARLGDDIKARLSQLIGQYGVVDVRGHGLMLGIELRDSQGRPDYARAEAVKLKAREHGLLVLTCGAKIGSAQADNATVRLIPPLNTRDEVAQRALDSVVSALRAVPVE